MGRCPSCGVSAPEAHRFCSSCGAGVVPAENDFTRTSLDRAASPSAAGGRAGAGEGRFLPGASIGGRYRIHGILGRGGMGEVYRADDLKLGQPVALKFLPEGLERDEALLARLAQEVRTARQVAHPNVCRVYDLGETGDQHYLSMEYIDGEDLASLLRRIGRLPEDRAVQIARQLCAGLAAAHAQGILHRDLKPANVMIDGRGAARITDFGLAGLAETVRGTAHREGTPAYMAPEQLAGGEASVRSDLYALGLVLYELFTGRRPFEARTPIDLARLQHESSPAKPSALVDGLDPAVERVILQCLEPEPSARPPSALAVAASFPGGDPLAEALAAGETPSPDLVAAAGRVDAQQPAVALGLAGLGLALFVAGAWLGGLQTLRVHVPLDKHPAALMDRAREMIQRLGYTEPAYAEPADSAFGYDIRWNRLVALEPLDPKARRASLRNPDFGVVDFWYRQSPRLLWPASSGRSFAGGRVERADPFPETTGGIIVGLDLAGRLRSFSCTPRRFTRGPPATAQPDWSLPFELAGFDPAGFERVEPRYQRFMAPDQRAAWLGHPPADSGEPLRIEAGFAEGRLVQFSILYPGEIEELAAQPESLRSHGHGGAIVLQLILLSLLGTSAALARRSLRSGRADRRGGARLAALIFAATCAFELLRSHVLYVFGGMDEVFPIAGTALFYTGIVLMLYYALEPYARRSWPSILISWSRLLGAQAVAWRDPLVGRSVLAGVVTGGALLLLRPSEPGLRMALSGVALLPDAGNWLVLLGLRHALAEVVGAVILAGVKAFLLAFTLIAAKLLFRNRWLAAATAAAAWLLFFRAFAGGSYFDLVSVSLRLFEGLVAIGVLARWGLVALLAALIVTEVSGVAYASDWTAWHGRPAWIAFAVVAALVLWGYRAAVGPRSLLGTS